MNLKILFTVNALVFALPAFAHEAENGPHGGRVTEAGIYHVELVAKNDLIEVFLTDASSKPVSAAGFKGVAIIVVDGKSARVTLESTGNIGLSGNAPTLLPAQPKGVVQITSPDGKTFQAKYN